MKIAVVGDLLLDSGQFGKAAGGAALAASLLARTGNNVQLVTVLPSDRSPIDLAAVLPGVSLAAAPAVTEEMLRCLDFADAIVVADGGRGLTCNDRLRWRLGVLACTVPIVWNQHCDGTEPVPGAAAVTLSGAAAARASGIDVQGQRSASDAASVLLLSWDAGCVSVVAPSTGPDSPRVRGTFAAALGARLAEGMAVSPGVRLAAQSAGIPGFGDGSLGLAFARNAVLAAGGPGDHPGS